VGRVGGEDEPDEDELTVIVPGVNPQVCGV